MEFNLDKYLDKAMMLLTDLISYPSILEENIDGISPFGVTNRKILEFFIDYAKKDGFDTINVKNYAGHIEYGEGNEILGILAHLDVVPVNIEEWESNPFTLTLRNNKLYARGIADDKGPLVASYIALLMLKDLGFKPNKRIRLIFGTDEESGSRCIKKYLEENEMPTIAFSPDADFPLINGEKGIISYDVNVFDNVIIEFISGERYNMVPSFAKAKLNVNLEKEYLDYLKETKYIGEVKDGYLIAYGKASHAMCPYNGTNAAYILFDFINKNTNSKLAEYISKYYLFDTKGEKIGYKSYDRIMQSLTSNFAVVDIKNYRGKFGVNCRVVKNSDLDNIEIKVKESIKPYGFEYKLLSKSNVHYVDANSFLVETLMNVYKKITNNPNAKPMTIGGGTYARECTNAVAFGPLFEGREDVCHIANEYMYFEDFKKLIEIYFYAIYELCK